jgi:hypothetical protein
MISDYLVGNAADGSGRGLGRAPAHWPYRLGEGSGPGAEGRGPCADLAGFPCRVRLSRVSLLRVSTFLAWLLPQEMHLSTMTF